MDQKTKGIIATVAAVLLCGCPGLFLCFFGATSVAASLMPGADINVMGSNDPSAGVGMGVVFLCVSLILISIPIAVGFFMLRKKPETSIMDGPVPPAS